MAEFIRLDTKKLAPWFDQIQNVLLYKMWTPTAATLDSPSVISVRLSVRVSMHSKTAFRLLISSNTLISKEFVFIA